MTSTILYSLQERRAAIFATLGSSFPPGDRILWGSQCPKIQMFHIFQIFHIKLSFYSQNIEYCWQGLQKLQPRVTRDKLLVCCAGESSCCLWCHLAGHYSGSLGGKYQSHCCLKAEIFGYHCIFLALYIVLLIHSTPHTFILLQVQYK